MLKSVFVREPRASLVISNVSLNLPKGEPFAIYTCVYIRVLKYMSPAGSHVPLLFPFLSPFFSRNVSSLFCGRFQIRRVVARAMAIALLARWDLCIVPVPSIVVYALIPVYYPQPHRSSTVPVRLITM